MNSSIPLADALRKGLALASLLENDELKTWLKNELDGYPDFLTVPNYRIISSPIIANYTNQLGQRMVNVPYPIENYPEDVRKNAIEINMDQGVRELEELTDGEYVYLTFPTNELPSPIKNMWAYEAYRQVHSGKIKMILDSVRTRLLELILDLEKKFPEMKKSEEAIRNADRAATSSVINVHINGNQNVVSAGSGITQNVAQQIRQGDLNSLIKSLETAGLGAADVSKVKDAIIGDGEQPPEKFGPKVRRVVAKLTEKFLEGTVGVAPGVLIEMLKKYYLPGAEK